KVWDALLEKAPTTPKRVEYGTPEMAYAVRRLFSKTDVKRRKIFAMAAHDGGLVTFGKDLQDAFRILMRHDEQRAEDRGQRSEVGRRRSEVIGPSKTKKLNRC